MSSSTTAASSDAAAAATAGYRTHYISSWHNYQLNVPSHLHSIAHYNAYCEERAKLYDRNAMVLRDNVVKITGWYWCTGFPAQNCADTNGYVDVRVLPEIRRNRPFVSLRIHRVVLILGPFFCNVAIYGAVLRQNPGRVIELRV